MPASERLRLLAPRLDLGLFARARTWKELFGRRELGPDLRRGLLLAASTLPLSILLANLAGAPASAGIFSAAVGSLLCVLLGGTRVALSGPGLTTAFVTSTIITRHGLEGLGVVLSLAGLLQILTGALGVGRFVRLVPLSVLRASVFGAGLIILLRQLPHALGAAVEPGGSVLVHLDGLGAQGLDPTLVAMAIGSGLLGALGLVRARLPGALLAFVVASLGAHTLGLELPTLHEADSFPLPRTPLPPDSGLAHLFGSVFELWGAMTLGTAIDTAALEKLPAEAGPAERADPDQELIGNGLATFALAFLHGLPTTQLVARAAIALRLGVSSRRPALVQALVVLGAGSAAWPLLRFVPLVALTGVAVYVALPLLDPRPLRELGRVSRLELGISVATIATMVFGGIVTGLLAGLALAFGTAALRMARTRALVQRSSDRQAPHQVSFSGPITFLAALELERLRAELNSFDPSHGLVMDLRSVVALDGNGALALVGALDEWRVRGGRVTARPVRAGS